MASNPNEPRPEVLWFAERMERKLLLNDHKGHWLNSTTGYLSKRLHQEAKELSGVLAERTRERGEWTHRAGSPALVERIIDEAADVANFAMMIADFVAPGVRKKKSAAPTLERRFAELAALLVETLSKLTRDEIYKHDLISLAMDEGSGTAGCHTGVGTKVRGMLAARAADVAALGRELATLRGRVADLEAFAESIAAYKEGAAKRASETSVPGFWAVVQDARALIAKRAAAVTEDRDE